MLPVMCAFTRGCPHPGTSASEPARCTTTLDERVNYLSGGSERAASHHLGSYGPKDLAAFQLKPGTFGPGIPDPQLNETHGHEKKYTENEYIGTIAWIPPPDGEKKGNPELQWDWYNSSFDPLPYNVFSLRSVSAVLWGAHSPKIGHCKFCTFRRCARSLNFSPRRRCGSPSPLVWIPCQIGTMSATISNNSESHLSPTSSMSHLLHTAEEELWDVALDRRCVHNGGLRSSG